MVQPSPKTAALNADSGSRISLRIRVHEKDTIPPLGDNGCEVDGGGGFPDPAFLVCDGYGFSHLSVELAIRSGLFWAP